MDKVCVSKLCGDKLCVSERRREAAERRGGEAERRKCTPKTRTPHKDVGNKWNPERIKMIPFAQQNYGCDITVCLRVLDRNLYNYI